MFLLLLILFSTSKVLGSQCAARRTQFGTVCVCNSTYCDTFPTVDLLEQDTFAVYSTSKTKAGFETRRGKLQNQKCSSGLTITVTQRTRQKIVGFGGAFTDSVGINIRTLPVSVQEKIIESYFGKSGIEYSLCRVPIAGSDYSTRTYTYDDTPGDITLEHFNLQPEDFSYKIPFIQQALKERGDSLKLLSSVWSPPIWMKTDEVWGGFNTLKPEFYQLYADYYRRFFEEYEKQNISFWGTTTGNEPSDAFSLPSSLPIPVLGWIPYEQLKWITKNLGPTVKKFNKNMKILIHDDSRLTFPYVVPLMINNTRALRYIDGVAVHWYLDDIVEPEVLDYAHTDRKDLILIMSEACFYLDRNILYGDWNRGAIYAASILFYLHRGYSGWIDWNMVINENGGPSYIDNFVDSPIVVNASAQEFYKQPMFYVLGHFSKFAVPNSLFVDVIISGKTPGLDSVAFLRPDKSKAVVIFNNGTREVDVQINDGNACSQVIKIQPYSINTIVYKKEN